MNTGRLIFAQLMDLFPKYEFNRIVDKWRGNWRVRQFSCFDQFLAMAFAQLTGRESLRDIQTCLSAMGSKLYHAGFRCRVSRSTLADANESRPWQIYQETALVLIGRARRLYVGTDLGLDLEETVYALDASIIDLCLTLFPWARLHHGKGGIKLHTLLDLRGNLPVSVYITAANVSDLVMLDRTVFEPGAIYIVDRGYLDFLRLWRLAEMGAFFITRPKRNTHLARLKSLPIDTSLGLRADQIVRPDGQDTKSEYPGRLRRISLVDPADGQRLVFLTNHFGLPAWTIAQLYKQRWNIELFFKWIKQHLRIKAFLGTSPNAVKTQIWIAICVYVMVAILKKQLDVPHSPYTILQVLSISLFEKTPILQALSQPDLTLEFEATPKQLTLFDF